MNEAWTAEYRLKQNTAALNGSFLHDQVDQVDQLPELGQVGQVGHMKFFEAVVMQMTLHYLHFGGTKVQKVHIFIKCCGKSDLPGKEERDGAGQAHGQRRSMDGGIPPETGHRCADIVEG